MKVFKGERIFLRKIKESDLTDRVMEWFKDEELMKFYTNSRRIISKDLLIESIRKGEDKGDLFTFGIFSNESESLIGTIKLGPINFSHRISDLVILIGDRKYLGKGLACEAIQLGNSLAFQEFDIRKLYGGMYESNIPSIKAYTKAGWLIEGRLSGFYLFNDKNEDRILVACFNPKYFSKQLINGISANQSKYFDV